MSNSGSQKGEEALQKRNRKMEQVRQWQKHKECFQVKEGRQKDKLFCLHLSIELFGES